MYQLPQQYPMQVPTAPLATFGIRRLSNQVLNFKATISNPSLIQNFPYKYVGKTDGHEVFSTAASIPEGIPLEQWKLVVARMKEISIKENVKRQKVLETVYTDPFLPYGTRSDYQYKIHGRIFNGGPEKRPNTRDQYAHNQWLQEKLATIPECDGEFITNEIHALMVEIVQSLCQVCPDYVFTYNYYPFKMEGNRVDKFEIVMFRRPPQQIPAAQAVSDNSEQFAQATPVPPHMMYPSAPQSYYPAPHQQPYGQPYPGQPQVILIQQPAAPAQQQSRHDPITLCLLLPLLCCGSLCLDCCCLCCCLF